MADTIPMLRREQRRHLLMNGWLIAGFVIVGTAVTNERGIFRPVGFDGLSATARAFIAMASPAGLPGLSPRLRDVRSVSSLNPFEVTAPSRDVRRRLIDALDWEPGDGEPGLPQQPLSFGDTPLTVADVGDTAPGGPPAFVSQPTQLGPNPPTPVIDAPGLQPGGGAVPEPATWAMLILGFGFIGSILRGVERRRRLQPVPAMRRRRSRATSRPAG